ncbi:globin [Sulfurimonas sp. SWIR-19]|uniref:globin domain-containing protein n=1 Tax=Sulfurimonas sp. SWIR-19 TaxID=2878390 RepID=UPI001CF24E7C|nr:globin [Sulfurimonas sp. SWIR-19]UCM99541.1 globin [Sulfurimonas sp. SWIR-19]
MNLEISQAQFGVRPPVTKPIPEFLLEVGEEGIRELISKHYDAIKQSDISHLFPQDDAEFEKAKVNSADFFIQICGGPKYFNQNRGAPQMVGRHAPFRIDAKARQTWLELYKPLIEALKEKGVTETSLYSFWRYLDIFSIWMINTQ